MKVSEIMSGKAVSCRPEDNVADVAWKMWENDCGALPVIGQDGKVLGVVTDRDICIGVALKNRLASNVAVKEVASGNVFACAHDIDVRTALQTMTDHKVRRLPVLNAEKKLVGVLSMNDVILHTESSKSANGVSYRDVVTTMKAICEHRKKPVRPVAA
jgi:CBS-domain-containing membrane protein